jgi:transcriptional regulator with XRE-family HTH domain
VADTHSDTAKSRSQREDVSASTRRNPQRNSGVQERVRSILALKGLTLSQVSQRSEALYGRTSPAFIPHNLYYDLRSSNSSPSIHQLVAMSRITGYRLPDWTRVFGADLEDIVRLQVLLPSRSTILLDSALGDPFSWVRWVGNREIRAAIPPVAPLGQLLKFTEMKQIRSLSHGDQSGFLYVKIGQQDALAFPGLVPGSIIRVNPDPPTHLLPHGSSASHRYFLVEHSRGLFCCQLRAIANHVLVPVSQQLSYAQVELRPEESRLLGVADFEIRPMSRLEVPTVPEPLARHWVPGPLSADTSIGPLLQHARDIRHISLREASAMSRKIAEFIEDERYFISPSSLCDYELATSTPRRVQTVVTLCSVYGLPHRTLLKALGIDLAGIGNEPVPDQLVFRGPPASLPTGSEETASEDGFLGHLLERCQEVPFFLRQTMIALSTLESISLEDFFWIGGKQEVLHPYLADGLLAIVNRRRKRPIHFPSKPLCSQPLYLLLRRDGTYLCACCGVENGSLIIHPYSKDFHRADVFRYRQDVEVVGQIVTIARRLT